MYNTTRLGLIATTEIQCQRTLQISTCIPRHDQDLSGKSLIRCGNALDWSQGCQSHVTVHCMARLPFHITLCLLFPFRTAPHQGSSQFVLDSFSLAWRWPVGPQLDCSITCLSTFRKSALGRVGLQGCLSHLLFQSMAPRALALGPSSC